MPALTNAQKVHAELRLAQLYNCVKNAVRYSLTRDDFVNGFIPDERDRWMFFNGAKRYAVRTSMGGVFVDVGSVKVYVMHSYTSAGDFIYPRETKLDPNSHIAWVLEDYAKQIEEISTDWTITFEVFNQLNELCSTAKQMRYLWPSLVALFEGHDLQKQIADASVPRTIPALPQWVREGCKIASTTIASTLLIGEVDMPQTEMMLRLAEGPMVKLGDATMQRRC